MKYVMVVVCILFCGVTAYGSGYINGQWIETNGYPLWRTSEDSLQYENRGYVQDSIRVAKLMTRIESGDYLNTPFQAEEMFGQSNENSDPIPTDWGYIEPPLTQWAPICYGFGGYSGRGYHLGDDACRPAGTPVYAVWSGYVKYARKHGCSGNWGYLQVIEHYFVAGYWCMVFCGVYGHLGQNMYPGEGRWVYEGQYLGCIGTTQESCQNPPHLHNGIHYGSYGVPTGEYAPWVCGYASSIPPNWTSPNDFYMYY